MRGEGKAKVTPAACERGVGYVVTAIRVDLIDVGEQDVREVTNDEAIVELAADIARRGLLQPIGVRSLPAGRFQLLWGKRRLTAHQRLGARLIEARVVQGSEEAVKAVALVENLHRRSMTISEECQAVAYLSDIDMLSPDQICTVLSKSRAWVNRRLVIPRMPVELRDAVLEGGVSIVVAEELCRLPESGQRGYLLQHALVGKLGASQVRAMVEAALGTPSAESAVSVGVEVGRMAGQRSAVMIQCAACAEMVDAATMAIVRVCAKHLTEGYASQSPVAETVGGRPAVGDLG